MDIGWGAIIVLRTVGLATVRRVAPKPTVEPGRASIDLETARAVIVNRMHVLRDYTRQVTLPALRFERRRSEARSMLARARKVLVRQPSLLDGRARCLLRVRFFGVQKLAEIGAAARSVVFLPDSWAELRETGSRTGPVPVLRGADYQLLVLEFTNLGEPPGPEERFQVEIGTSGAAAAAWTKWA